MATQRPEGLISQGELSNTRGWSLFESHTSGVVHGRHYITVFSDSGSWNSIEELSELFSVAVKVGQQHSLVEGKWRIGMNGPGLCHRPHTHFHTIMPSEQDEPLPRFVSTTERIAQDYLRSMGYQLQGQEVVKTL